MKSLRLMILFAFGLLVVAPCVADDLTVGEFVQELASGKRVRADTPRVAAASLAALGAPIPSTLDLSSPLTEGDIVAITRSMGLRLTTSRPHAPFGRFRVDRFFGMFASELGLADPLSRDDEDDQGDQDEDFGDGLEGPDFDPFSKGKGKGKQIVTETEI